jgi:hypothetical protein
MRFRVRYEDAQFVSKETKEYANECGRPCRHISSEFKPVENGGGRIRQKDDVLMDEMLRCVLPQRRTNNCDFTHQRNQGRSQKGSEAYCQLMNLLRRPFCKWHFSPQRLSRIDFIEADE